MKSVELFSGAGGLALGIHLSGFENQLLVEADDNAYETLVYNRDNDTVPGISSWSIVHDRVEFTDLTNYQNIDLLAAGIPCQAFSNGGKRRGIEDHRNMFPIFAKALATIKPKAFMLENVNGLINGKLASHMEYIILQLSYPWFGAKNGQEWKDHFKELKEIDSRHIIKDNNYKVSFHVINAADYGIPQVRKRVFIIGFRKDLRINWSFPESTHSKEALLTKKLISNSHSPRNKKNKDIFMNNIEAWITVDEAIKDLPKMGSTAAAAVQHLFLPGARSYKGHTGSASNWPAKSLKAGTHGIGGGENMLRNNDGSVRYFTVRECARLQTFPDTWIFKGPWSSVTRQLGNAVPIKLAKIVADNILSALESTIRVVS